MLSHFTPVWRCGESRSPEIYVRCPELSNIAMLSQVLFLLAPLPHSLCLCGVDCLEECRFPHFSRVRRWREQTHPRLEIFEASFLPSADRLQLLSPCSAQSSSLPHFVLTVLLLPIISISGRCGIFLHIKVASLKSEKRYCIGNTEQSRRTETASQITILLSRSAKGNCCIG